MRDTNKKHTPFERIYNPNGAYFCGNTLVPKWSKFSPDLRTLEL